MSDIFVSHAAPDKVLVDKFVDLLIATLNITSDRFFCTSLEGLGIKPGEDFLSTIKSNIQSPKLVVFLITPNYLRSQFCLCEMGASWAMSHEVVILKTSNVSLSDLSSIVSSNQIVDIQDFSLLGGVADKIKSILRLEFSTARWTVKCKQFLKDVEKILGEMEFDPIVSLDKYNALLQEKDDFEKQLTESYLKIDNLEGLVKRLEGAKDAEEVSRIKLESLAGYEAFTTLCESVKTCLKKFPRIVHATIVPVGSLVVGALVEVEVVIVLLQPRTAKDAFHPVGGDLHLLSPGCHGNHLPRERTRFGGGDQCAGVVSDLLVGQLAELRRLFGGLVRLVGSAFGLGRASKGRGGGIVGRGRHRSLNHVFLHSSYLGRRERSGIWAKCRPFRS